jgi:UDP-N-acetylglucosamine 1-carboxyvinyltransferase
MDNFVIHGGKKLEGEVRISGSKNAALPILAATLLTKEKCVVRNVPDLRDIKSTFDLLNHAGKKCFFEANTFTATEPGRLKHDAPYDLVRRMRASVLAAGPLLARLKKVRVSLPGGCSIGVRPIDIHIEAFKKLGAEVASDKGDLILTGAKLKPGRVRFRFPSVGATENLMMCAALLDGKTTLENCAREPEIEDLAEALRRMGAEVEGAGGSRITVRGRPKLKGLRHTVIPDRIETGTFLLAAAAAGGRVKLSSADPKPLAALLKALERSGAKVSSGRDWIILESAGGRPRPVNVSTAPHPGFPTDLQAPWMSYMVRCRGNATVQENIFENRFMHAAELLRMGASVYISGNKAYVHGVEELTGAPIMASDIRAGAALLVAAGAARGKSLIRRIYHIDRGYERVERKLRALGMKIERVKA